MPRTSGQASTVNHTCTRGGGNVSAGEVANLLEQDRTRVLRALDQLFEVHLLSVTPSGHYRLPALVRQVAIEISRENQPATRTIWSNSTETGQSQ
jgi:DNA-binding IclR family transcriptional regulator